MSRKPNLTKRRIRKAIRAFHKDHGRHPGGRDGDASAYFGYPETWGAVAKALRYGSRGIRHSTTLAREAKDMGLTKPLLTEEIVKEAIRAFYAKHVHHPNAKSGDASAYFGYPTNWMNLEADLRLGLRGLPGNTCLFALACEMGLAVDKPDLTQEIVEDAIRSFHKEHGTRPTLNNGDATAYFGYQETWAAIETALRNGCRGLPSNKSLKRLSQGLGLGKMNLTQEIVEEAVRAFHKDHGRHPRVHEGDATAYFGYQETWRSVNAALSEGLRGLQGGITLSKLAKRMGLVSRC